VREIFQRYADGWTVKAICTDLNRRKVPQPGAKWDGPVRRARGWFVSAILGDSGRGKGLLRNEKSIGRVTYRKMTVERSAQDSADKMLLKSGPGVMLASPTPRSRSCRGHCGKPSEPRLKLSAMQQATRGLLVGNTAWPLSGSANDGSRLPNGRSVGQNACLKHCRSGTRGTGW
jgi:hypothetical protein